MSVTFTPDETPAKIACPYCVDAREHGDATPEGRCDRFCEGFVEEYGAMANFSNSRAADILKLLGFSGDDLVCGSLTANGVADLRRQIVRARNSDRSSLIEAPYHHQGGFAGPRWVQDSDGTDRVEWMGAQVVSFGNTDEDTLDRLDRLDRVLIYAQERNLGIRWS